MSVGVLRDHIVDVIYSFSGVSKISQMLREENSLGGMENVIRSRRLRGGR